MATTGNGFTLMMQIKAIRPTNLMNKPRVLLPMILFSLPFLCTTVIRAQERVTKDRNQTIKVDVDLVLVNASVSDSQGRMVAGLRQENFRLWEDKVEQKVEYFSSEDSPVSIGLIFDATGSMQDKISRAREAAVSFLKTGNLDDEFFLVTFSQSPRLTDGFTTDISGLQSHMIFTPAKGLTPLYDAAYLGLETMKSARNKRKALLLITDGEDNHSRYSFSDIKEFVKEQDVQIFIIGIVNPSGELGSDLGGRAIIEDLAQISGGQAFFPDSADELEDICNKIALELRNQYVLGYHSTNETKDGKWRKIRVKINPPKGHPNLSVHSKSGYYAETLDIKP
jgi:Ca-activated chloride channel homolog